MSDLREKLARTLWARLLREHPNLYRNPEFPSEKDHGTLWTAADECIRQMEWAAECALVSVSEPGRDWAENRREFPDRYPALTPAPDDWKPE